MKRKLWRTVGLFAFSTVVAVTSAGLVQASPTFTITSTRATPPPTAAPHACASAVAGSECWEGEPGQSMPSGTVGWLNGLITVNAAGVLQFTYGAGLLAGDTGHGNSLFPNEFWVEAFPGQTEAQAEAAGNCFATQAGTGCAKTTVGDTFSVNVGAGALPFHLRFGSGALSTLNNGQTNDAAGAYLATCAPLSTTAPNSGPCILGYLGLTDSAYQHTPPLDHDFQDLVLRINSVPEPASLLLFGFGLIGAAYAHRRKITAA